VVLNRGVDMEDEGNTKAVYFIAISDTVYIATGVVVFRSSCSE